MKTGLVSITFRKKSPQEIIELVTRAGLGGIEWGGDVHVPHGDTKTAAQVLADTRKAGLEVACYGSYYRVGHSEDAPKWEAVLNSARALEAPLIRVWVGKRDAEKADAAYWKQVIDDLKRITDSASQHDLFIATEFHGGTLCNTGQSTLQVLAGVNHPHLKTLWQPAVARSIEKRLEDLKLVAPHLQNIHVFQWGDKGGSEKFPLQDGANEWRKYLQTARDTVPDREMFENHFALLEFVRNDSDAAFLEDAQTLKQLIGEVWAQN